MDEYRWPGESRYHKKQVLRNFMISTTLFIKVGIYVQLQSKQDASPTTYRTYVLKQDTLCTLNMCGVDCVLFCTIK